MAPDDFVAGAASSKANASTSLIQRDAVISALRAGDRQGSNRTE